MFAKSCLRLFVAALFCVEFAGIALAGDQPQWGQKYTRNMVSAEKGLPESCDIETGKNLKWSVPVGGAYGSPIVAEGCVFIGSNNEECRDPRFQGDHGVLLCLDKKDGSLRWQFARPRMEGDIYRDWVRVAFCSPPTVDEGRVYVVTNRHEVACLDVDGMSDGNDGPFLDEKKLFASEAAAEATPPSATDFDVIWMVDLLTLDGVKTYPHDAAHGSILVDGPYLYLNTSNGVDNTHRKIRAPDAPSLIVLEKATGRLVAKDVERMGPRIVHASWSSPSLGEVNGQRLVFFGGGDGVCYAFKALDPKAIPQKVVPLEKVWQFDCDPDGPKENVHLYMGNRQESASNILSMPVFADGKVFVTYGGDVWWGKREASLVLIDPTGQGDVTKSAKIWSYPLQQHCCTTPAVHDGLVFVADSDKTLHCVDQQSGEVYWTANLGRECWGSPLVADGKVYIGARNGKLWVFGASKNKQEIGMIRLKGQISATPAASDGTLYINTLDWLYAIQQE